MKTALLLIAHGSSQPEANDDLHFAAAELRKRGGFDVVEASFLELAAPSIADGAACCVRQGAARIVMLPYFLSAGVHVRKDLTRLQSELKVQFPTVEFRLAEPLGRHPRLLDVVAARAQEALGEPGA